MMSSAQAFAEMEAVCGKAETDRYKVWLTKLLAPLNRTYRYISYAEGKAEEEARDRARVIHVFKRDGLSRVGVNRPTFPIEEWSIDAHGARRLWSVGFLKLDFIGNTPEERARDAYRQFADNRIREGEKYGEERAVWCSGMELTGEDYALTVRVGRKV